MEMFIESRVIYQIRLRSPLGKENIYLGVVGLRAQLFDRGDVV